MKATSSSMRASRRLRREMTKPEILLWQHLRGSPSGVSFRKQYAIGPYVADFYCARAKLVIEIDGQIHDFEGQAKSDASRDEHIAGYGVRVQRIAAREVLDDPAGVAAAIVDLCLHGPLPYSASPSGPPPHRFATGRSE
jgi:very-short-patch-repair endonuclease